MCCSRIRKRESQESSASGSSKTQPGNIDEINKYVNPRFYIASESFWQICAFDVHGREPSIQRLTVHEENS